MGTPPWLDSLSDDWVSLPGTPSSPAPRSPINNHSRRSSVQNTPSRIPVPARRPVDLSPSSEAKKKVTRPCHFHKREPPTPKTPRSPKTPSKLRSPVPDKSKKGPMPNPPSGRRAGPSATDGRSPLRSVSNASSQPGEQSTVQIRPKKDSRKEGTPEWRRRLVNGEIPSSDQRDLFAPIGLESVFKPPSPGSPLAGSTPIPRMKQPGDGWNFSSINSRTENKGKSPGRISRSSRGSDRKTSGKPASARNPRSSLGRARDTTKPQDDERELKRQQPKQSSYATKPQTESQDDAQMRSASGLEDLRNEDITPITFSQTNTVDGNGTAEIIKSALKQVTSKLEQLHLAPEDRPDSRASDSVLFGQPGGIGSDGEPEDDLVDVTSNSLPQDLSMGTLDYRGRSAFASLQGEEPFLNERSFHKDRFSPTAFPAHRLSPFARPSLRIRSSPPFYTKTNARTDPPTLPRPSSAHVGTSASKAEAMLSSGSPLKLFSTHDTFTNNKLLRRMSQFEETLGDESEEDEPVSPSEEARRKGENRSLLNAKPDHWGERLARRQGRPRTEESQTPHINRFGEGQLDNFDFSDASPYDGNFLHTDSPDPNLAPPGQLLSAKGKYQGRYRQTSGNSATFYNLTFGQNGAGSYNSSASEKRESKLKLNPAPGSPVKDPTPKRRRTIMKPRGSFLGVSDLEDSAATDDLSLLQRSLMQHGLKYDSNEAAILSESGPRPRTPTPHQTGSFERKQTSPNRRTQQLGPNDDEVASSPAPQAVPNAIGRPANEEVRKGSITTQDFLNEATKVMNFIRSKGTAKSSLSRVDESDVEQDGDFGSYEEESTLEEFSRPPSREGIDLRKYREPKEQNPRILSHLKKFQEHDELEFGANGSVMGLHLRENSNESQRSDSESWARGLHSEHRKRKLPVAPSTQEDDLYDFLRLDTAGSAASFSARSFPTGSSQGSHAKGVLSSDIVSHLIPEQVNGLTYDRLKHQWVKENDKQPRANRRGRDGDDDPFKDIPDLSVDELEEMMRTQNSGSPQKAKSSQPERSDSPQDKASNPGAETAPVAPSVNLSSVQSGISQSTSTQPTSGTRETSWGTNVPKSRTSSTDVEHEIKLHEGRLSKTPHHLREPNHQARVVTISFSSPLVSQIEYSDDDSPSKLRKVAITSQAQAAAAHSQPQPSDYEQAFRRRSISKIDEGSEDTAEEQSLMRRNAGALQPTAAEGCIDEPLTYLENTGLDTSYSFHLSPLPDFTVDQIDQPLHFDASYVAQRTHPTSLRQVHGTFALATEDLVKHITEAEPYEPYWEHLRRLILRRKGLITLHKLSEFCPRLEELDVSENDIGQLSGVPSTLRNLSALNNCLSNLTAWSHLVNLQYLDISGNELDNLDGVSELIHLRELRADNNNIQNIEGVFGLNGLLTLKIRNNCLKSVDFETAELIRLGELDMSQNELVSVRSIQNLPALAQLDLTSNKLEKLTCSSPLDMLRGLKLSNNRLRHLDIECYPALTLLYADQNCISTISGISHTRDLEVLSAREQSISNDRNGGFFELDLGTVKDIRKVYLSSNKLSAQTISPSTPLLSLQLLDLASCRLESLPEDFAVKFPNLKVLNLNFNSLLGVNELLGMNCLSRLAIAGNSISRLRRLCQVLSRVGRTNKSKACTLQKVDIRGNPLTVRFYPPPITGNGKQDTRKLILNERTSFGNHGVDLDLPLMRQLDREGQLVPTGEEDDTERDPEINDPYTLPLADPLLDQKHLSRLDQGTRLKRRVFELMLYAGTGGALKYLDGLEFRPVLEPGSDMNQAWTRLEQLGVLKKKAIAG